MGGGAILTVLQFNPGLFIGCMIKSHMDLKDWKLEQRVIIRNLSHPYMVLGTLKNRLTAFYSTARWSGSSSF